MSREKNVKIFEDTLAYIKENQTLTEAVKNTQNKTKLFKQKTFESNFNNETKRVYLNNVFVTKNKTFEAALKLHKYYPNYRIGVLNFASATNPGGGVTKGSSAQEESLCRCSTLYSCLNTNKLLHDFYYYNRNLSNPLHTDDIIYTPDIVICKTDDGRYMRLKDAEFVKVDVLSCAAPNLRENPNNSFNIENAEAIKITDDKLYNLHLNRARFILEVAYMNGIRVLVLGAFGCGAFRNNPEIVAKAYRDALKEYAKYFVEIEFAVYCKDYETENYDTFERILGQ